MGENSITKNPIQRVEYMISPILLASFIQSAFLWGDCLDEGSVRCGQFLFIFFTAGKTLS